MNVTRMNEDLCMHCKWWDRSKSTVEQTGRCIYNPPVFYATETHADTVWPYTNAFDMCSKYEERK